MVRLSRVRRFLASTVRRPVVERERGGGGGGKGGRERERERERERNSIRTRKRLYTVCVTR